MTVRRGRRNFLPRDRTFFSVEHLSLDHPLALPDRSRVQCSDEDYVRSLRAPADPECRAVVAELRGVLRRALARSFGRQLADADLDDLIQESLLRIHARLDSFEHHARFTTWAIAIAVNCALSELRLRRYRHVSLEDAAVQGNAALAQEPQLLASDDEHTLLLLRRGIAEVLTERQREATLAKLSGLPLMEIGRRLGSSQGAVYKLLHDARQRLKAYLEAALQLHEGLASEMMGAP